MTYKKEKNLLGKRDVYNKCYSNFRGVDFSNDHTQVADNRFAYAVNMYKDYHAGEGQAIETIPGFRIGMEYSGKVFGIHTFKYKDGEESKTKILVHFGKQLIHWINYPRPLQPLASAEKGIFKTLIENGVQDSAVASLYHYNIKLPVTPETITVYREDGSLVDSSTYTFEGDLLTLSGSTYKEREIITIYYIVESLKSSHFVLLEENRDFMNEAKSTSFIFNNKLYILDGENFLVYDGESLNKVEDFAYIPTTFRFIVPSGENADNGIEYEQRNLLQSKFKNTFVTDGTTTEYFLNEKNIDSIVSISNGEEEITSYTVDLAQGKITFKEAPKSPLDLGLKEGTDCLVIVASKSVNNIQGLSELADARNLIRKCTIAAVFDNRIFLSGNPECPNHMFFCSNNNLTGYIDPSYWGILNYKQDGVGSSKITGMISVADTLMVLKEDSSQEGCVFYHTRRDLNSDVYPVDYPSTQGLNGVGCLGACVNFLDDPVFVSRLGLEAIGQLSARYERAIEHRSSLVDAKLVNLDLKNSVLEEWNGYLLLLVDGKIFMADSRQKYTDNIGNIQYDWYFLDDIGVYKDQYQEYTYVSQIYEDILGKTVIVDGKEYPIALADAVYNPVEAKFEDLRGNTANSPNEAGASLITLHNSVVQAEVNSQIVDFYISYVIKDDKALLCESAGNFIGGVFKKAITLKAIDGNLLFGTESGYVCIFNFDKRDSLGKIDSEWYSFNKRTIYSGCATKMDCCGIPHLTKNTVKKSTVIKTKSIRSSAAKIKVRTNKDPYKQIARINSNTFDFSMVDFSDLSFNTEDQSLFSVKEKEKQWVEKQYFIYSDEYLRPFALFYIAYRYNIIGRYKG